MHIAQFYKQTANGITCELCPHFCGLKEGQTGICRTRINKGNELWSLSYGKPVAVHEDPIEKKPLYHFMPGTTSFSLGTAGCNLGCLNCQNWEISRKGPHETNHLLLDPIDVVKLAIQHRCPSISYTYTDPVVFYEYMVDIAQAAHENGLANVMVSAGYINPLPLKKLTPLLDAANIDLKTFDAHIYKTLNKASLNEVLQTLVIIKEQGVWLEITNLVIPSYTDHLPTIEKMCRWLADNGFADTPLHFSRFHPMYQLAHLPSTETSVINQAAKIASECGINYVYVGNIPNHPMQHTLCHACGHRVIERNGYSTSNHLTADGECPHCGTKIPGCWVMG
jgi:pyruvate formate lyase activating enzyme